LLSELKSNALNENGVVVVAPPSAGLLGLIATFIICELELALALDAAARVVEHTQPHEQLLQQPLQPLDLG
jgi:hypothetical protein